MRVATFNLENLDDPVDDPALLERRVAVLRPQLLRLAADVLCLQEVNAQPSGHHGPRRLAALDRLLEDTPYAGFHRATSEREPGGGPADVHNLVTLSRYPIVARRQVRHDLVSAPSYRLATAEPRAEQPQAVEWDRPLLLAELDVEGTHVHVLNLHLRAPLAGFVPGQKLAPFRWRTIGGWAEGFFLATVKRAGQAFEARLLVEQLFEDDPDAMIVVAGDCNAGETEMPLRILLGEAADTGNDALAARSLVSVERGTPSERRFSVRHAGRAVMLDHLLVSRRLFTSLRSVAIHNEELADEVFAAAEGTAREGSFHAPLVAAFAIDVRRDGPPFTAD
ncbi:endonuclease/exonuclease/phosphatase family metal-dependent hydrolase [Constrictibacter sp. MBR-5]|jgi:endonuclease/exonuclease/phosphatase family metal-dependent hydrolase|uniref:endonuclease/exonuclease/phosphatase family protein n=1 Tax=Constrictibacter sp. MBR-5 TaxID=3156467 RepID=UPI0033949886